YIEENYSKIRDVERELENLTLDMKLIAGPKKAALEHMRKKIEMSTERIRVAKLNEEQARKTWEAASKAIKDEEAIKEKLCKDLNNLVQESSNTQLARMEELKRRLEALNPSRSSISVSYVCPCDPQNGIPLLNVSAAMEMLTFNIDHDISSSSSIDHDGKPMGPIENSLALDASSVPPSLAPGGTENIANHVNAGNAPGANDLNQQPSAEGEGKGKKKIMIQGRGKGLGAVPKGRVPPTTGWTGAGFDVDGRT
ncbi:hypothetical protein C3L33_03157, partial [Rhododendron williamsianum]